MHRIATTLTSLASSALLIQTLSAAEPTLNSLNSRISSIETKLISIEQAVKGDNEAELVLMAWSMGYSGSEARTETGLDAKQFDAARQRLMRKLKPVATVRNSK